MQKGVKKSSLRFQRTNRSRTLNLKDKVTVLATSVQITVKPIDLLPFSYGVHMYAQVIITSIYYMNSVFSPGCGLAGFPQKIEMAHQKPIRCAR